VVKIFSLDTFLGFACAVYLLEFFLRAFSVSLISDANIARLSIVVIIVMGAEWISLLASKKNAGSQK